jgi:hypothetical protein
MIGQPNAILAANLSNNFMDMSNTAKQHSFSDDQLNSTKNDGKTQIAKFSDVPPLLVDSQPTALNGSIIHLLIQIQ